MGILLASGLIVGESLFGVFTAIGVCLLIVKNVVLAMLLFAGFVGTSLVFAVLFWGLLKMLAFVGNSILCRLALKQTQIDAASFTLIRLSAGALVLWALSSREFRASGVNWLAGLGIGAVITAMWWVTGSLGHVAEHPETLESVYLGTAGGRIQALSFTSPMARSLEWFMSFDANMKLTLGVVSVAGVVVGSFVYAVAKRSFHWEGFQSTQDTAMHLIGAFLMGVGGVTAGGCTVGQGLSGLSTLSLTSLIAVAGIVLGALGGLRLQLWLVMRE